MSVEADDSFDLGEFLPYLLNRAAEETSLGFESAYRSRYGMLRTEWRVLFHLGRYQSMSASDVCERARLHKTKVSRAVAALESKRFLRRERSAEDRRCETLSLTRKGQAAYRYLAKAAHEYDDALALPLDAEEARVLRRCLRRLAGM